MAILQRTPPARRPIQGTEVEPATSSPSRSRLMRSSERQPASKADSFVFPSLDAMAAERQAAMSLSLAPRNLPILSISSKARNSLEASGGSLGTSSANSRKIIGGQVGRNAPVLSATVAKSHAALGESHVRSIQSPRLTSKSSTPRQIPSVARGAPVQQRSGSILSRDQSPAAIVHPDAHDSAVRNSRSTSRDLPVLTTSTTNIEKSAFEAQMERALASGANPFQDRKRDLMRGESRIPVVQHEEQTISGPRRSFLKLAELVGGEEERSAADDKMKIASPTPFIPKVTPPQSPMILAKIQVAQASMHSPASQSSKEVISKLKAQIEEKTKRVEVAQAEVVQAQKYLKEKEKLDRQQKDMIKSLERRILDQSLKYRDTEIIQVRLIEFEWESLRDKCKNIIERGVESREREIESIISRNEVSYMDSRRVETELDLKEMECEANRVSILLDESENKRKQLKSNLRDLEREKSTLDENRANEGKLETALTEERQRRKDLQDEFKDLRERVSKERGKRIVGRLSILFSQLAKEESNGRSLKQRQALSPVRRGAMEAETRKSSPARRIENNDKKNASPIKSRAVTSSKTKVVGEIVRQSPRKKLSAFVRSTSAKIQSTVMRQSDGISDDEHDNDDEIIEEAVNVKAVSQEGVVKGKQVVSKTKKGEPIMEETNCSDEEEEPKEVTLPKKKGGILSRAKYASEKNAVAISSKRKSDSRGEEARMMEIEREVQQTPMIHTKKKKEKLDLVKNLNDGEDESLDAEATPIVKPNTKQKAASRLVEETTKTPVIRSKKRKGEINSIEVSTVEISKKDGDNGQQKKKKRRILKRSTNIANGFLNCDGDAEGDLDPKLNLPLQLSPIKGNPSSSTLTTLGTTRGTTTSRIFGR